MYLGESNVLSKVENICSLKQKYQLVRFNHMAFPLIRFDGYLCHFLSWGDFCTSWDSMAELKILVGYLLSVTDFVSCY